MPIIDVPVPPSADLSRVTELLKSVGEEAYRDSRLTELLLDEPTVMGVESIEVDQVNLRLVARTLPGKQFEVGRERLSRTGVVSSVHERRRVLAAVVEAATELGLQLHGALASPIAGGDGNREFLDGKAFVEAFVLAGALCAVTTRLRFNFFVLKLPIRPPALVAKQAGSLAAVFGNRLGLGVGTSPWPEDYELLGVPFAKRGKRMDECIEIIKGLTSGDYFEFHGEFYDIPKTKMTPAPNEPIPILIGGHAEAALASAKASRPP